MLGAIGLGIAETLFSGLEQRLQLFAITNDLALRRGPGAQAAAQWSHLIISIRLFRRDLGHAPFNAYLALQGWPEEGHGRKRPRRELLTLGALIVGEEGKALCIQALEQQDAAVRATVLIHRRQRHGIGLHWRLFGFHRITKPLVEQRKRLVRGLGFSQNLPCGFTVPIGQGLGFSALSLWFNSSVFRLV